MLDSVLSPSAHPRPGDGPRGVGGTGVERFRLVHRALPGRDLDAVDLTTTLLGAELAAPLALAASGEGVRAAAHAAAEHGLGLIVESAGAPDHYRTPDRPPLLVAGMPLADLLDADGPDRAERLAVIADADALAIEIDPLGDALDPAGRARYGCADAAIAAVTARLAPLPVLVRARDGTDAADVRVLQAAGVAAIDVGGESRRPRRGVPTADAVAEAALVAPGLPVLAGGTADAAEIAVHLALGAAAASVPWHTDAAVLVRELRAAVWATGAPAAATLTPGYLRAT